MTPSLQALYGLLMIALGGVKTWLHIGTIPVLTLPTCNGKTLNLAMSNASLFEQAHCWGCYMFTAGSAVLLIALYRYTQKRRSVASRMD